MHHILQTDDNKVAVITPYERFCIKGTDIFAAIEEVLSCFNQPMHVDDVISNLSKKYSVATLEKIIDLLINKSLIITENDFNFYASHSDDFLTKTLGYGSWARSKALHEIIDQLNTLSVGIVGTSHVVSCIVDNLLKEGLLTKLNIGHTDKTPYPNINKIVESCDFIITASNYFDHYMFEQINQLCLKENKNWLRIVIDGMNAEIGPIFVPCKTSCYSCLKSRWQKGQCQNIGGCWISGTCGINLGVTCGGGGCGAGPVGACEVDLFPMSNPNAQDK